MTNKTTKEAFNLMDLAIGETPAALRAGLGGALGGLAVKYLPKDTTTRTVALHSLAPLAGLGLGGAEAAIGAAAPILMKKNDVLGASLMGAALGGASTLAPVVLNPTLESAPGAIASLAGSALLARTSNKLDDISNAVKYHADLKADILPKVDRTMSKQRADKLISDSKNRIYEEAIPAGKYLVQKVDNYKKNKYIAKELEEVEKLLKEPGENYKVGHVKEAAPWGGIAKTLAGGLAGLGLGYQGFKRLSDGGYLGNTAADGSASPGQIAAGLGMGGLGATGAVLGATGKYRGIGRLLGSGLKYLAPQTRTQAAGALTGGIGGGLYGIKDGKESGKSIGGTLTQGLTYGLAGAALGRMAPPLLGHLGKLKPTPGSAYDRLVNKIKPQTNTQIGTTALGTSAGAAGGITQIDQDDDAKMMAGKILGGAALGYGAGRIVPPILGATWKGTQAVGRGVRSAATYTKQKAVNANNAIQATNTAQNADRYNILGGLAGGAAGGYAAYNTGDEQTPMYSRIGRAALGAGLGAVGGRGLVRGTRMALGTNYGNALKQQAVSRAADGTTPGFTGYARQAFGGFRQNAGRAANEQAANANNALSQQLANSKQDLYHVLTKDMGTGGYGLAGGEARNVIGDIQTKLGPNASKRDLAASLLGGRFNSTDAAVGGLLGAASSGYAAGSATDWDPTAIALGAVAGGGLGAAGAGSARYIGKALSGIPSGGNNLRKEYLSRLSDSKFLNNEISSGRLAISNPATATKMQSSINKANAGIAVKPETGFFSVNPQGELAYTAGSNASNIQVTGDVAKGLGALDPRTATNSINKAISSLAPAEQQAITQVLNKGGQEAELMQQALAAHTKDVINVTNKTHGDVANLISASVKNSARASGLEGSAYGANVEYLMSREPVKALANKINTGKAPNIAEIEQALIQSGVPAVNAKGAATALQSSFDDIAKATQVELTKANSAFTKNMGILKQNINAGAYDRSVQGFEQEFARAATKGIPKQSLDHYKAELDDLVNMQRTVGDSAAAKQVIDDAKALLANDKLTQADVSSAITALKLAKTTLVSGNKGLLGNFRGYSDNLSKTVSKELTNIGDDFAENLVPRLNPTDADLISQVNNITKLPEQARKLVASGDPSSVKNFQEVEQVLAATKGSFPSITKSIVGKTTSTQMYNLGKSPKIDEYTKNLASTSGKNSITIDKQATSILNQLGANGIDTSKVIAKHTPMSGTLDAPAAARELLAEIRNYTAAVDTQVASSIKAFKDSAISSIANSGSAAGSAQLRGFGTISRTKADDDVLKRISPFSKTEAPITKEISQTTAAPVANQTANTTAATAAPVQEAQAIQQAPMPVQQAVQPQAQGYGMLPMGAGVVGVGGVGYGGYHLLSAPTQQAAQYSAAPVQGMYSNYAAPPVQSSLNYTMPPVQNRYNPMAQQR